MPRRIPQVINGLLTSPDGPDNNSPALVVGSTDWYTWLENRHHSSFAFQTSSGGITVRREQKRNSFYQYAYRRQGGKTLKAYVGRSQEVTLARLQEVAALVLGPSLAAPLHLYFLGSPRIVREQPPVEGLNAKAIALLAYLAVHTLFSD